MATAAVEKTKTSLARNQYDLTECQEQFCALLAYDATITLIDAYLLAYPNFGGTRTVGMVRASELWRLDKIKARVEAMRDVFVSRCPMSKGEAMTILAGIARKCQTSEPSYAMAAIRELRSLIPEWNAEPVEQVPESITVTIVNETRERPQRVLTESTIEVRNINDV